MFNVSTFVGTTALISSFSCCSGRHLSVDLTFFFMQWLIYSLWPGVNVIAFPHNLLGDNVLENAKEEFWTQKVIKISVNTRSVCRMFFHIFIFTVDVFLLAGLQPFCFFFHVIIVFHRERRQNEDSIFRSINLYFYFYIYIRIKTVQHHKSHNDLLIYRIKLLFKNLKLKLAVQWR